MRIVPVLTYLMIVAGPLSAQTDTAVTIAAQEAERGWTPRVVQTGDAVVYPYGHTQPIVTCAPLHACVIELEAGERVLATALGDTERWLVDQATTGARTPLVIVKPTACDLATNLVISTDRRVYDLALDSPVCSRGAVHYTRRVRFYYPGTGLVQPSMVSSECHAESLSFSYRWTADRRSLWSPVAVYDDGEHAYVRLPESSASRHGDLPVLLLELDDKSTGVLNYVVANDTYITDRIFSRAILRDGGRQIEIVNTRLAPAR
jgi:type IV secretion system protein TrbG